MSVEIIRYNIAAGLSFVRSMAVCLAIAAFSGCGDSTGPAAVTLDLRGRAMFNGAPMSGATVILRDQRSPYDPGVVLRTATTDANGNYEIRVRAQRPGYAAGCEFLTLFVENHEYSTNPSAPIRCISETQVIDLAAAVLIAAVHVGPKSGDGSAERADFTSFGAQGLHRLHAARPQRR